MLLLVPRVLASLRLIQFKIVTVCLRMLFRHEEGCVTSVFKNLKSTNGHSPSFLPLFLHRMLT